MKPGKHKYLDCSYPTICSMSFRNRCVIGRLRGVFVVVVPVALLLINVDFGLISQKRVRYLTCCLLTGCGRYFVHFFAPKGMEPIPKDALFILDVSGSMGGKKMKQVKGSHVENP